MTYSPSIQSLISDHNTQSGHGGNQSVVDITDGLVYIASIASSDGKNYLSVMGLYTGLENNFALLTNSGEVAPPVALDANGIYVSKFASGINQLNSSSLGYIQTFLSGFANNVQGGNIIPLNNGGTNYLLVTGPGNIETAWEIFSVVNSGTGVQWGPGGISYGNRYAYGVAGAAGTGVGYVISTPLTGADSQILTFFSVDAVGSTYSNLGTISPTDVDSGWSEIFAHGVCLDQTDNKLLVLVGNGASAWYLVKVNPSGLGIDWKTATPGGNGGSQMAWSSIQYQRYCQLASTGVNTFELIQIDTSDGSSSSYTTGFSNMIVSPYQSFHDSIGVIVGEFGYVAGAGSPTQRNSTPASFTGWSALYVAPPLPPPPPPGVGRRFLAELGPVKVVG